MVNWTDPKFGIRHAKDFVPLDDGRIVVLFMQGGVSSLTVLPSAATAATPKDCGISVSVEGALEGVSAIFPAEGDKFLAKVDAKLLLATLPTGATKVSAATVIEVPTASVEMACTWLPGRGIVVASLEDRNTAIDDQAPMVYPPPPRDLTLMVFSPWAGWEEWGKSPQASEQLVISDDGSVVGWRVMTNLIPEEAERGEFWACGRGHPPHAITQGAGRVGSCIIAHDGSFIVLQANYSIDRPITTTMQLRIVPYPAQDITAPPVQGGVTPFTEAGAHVEVFGWVREQRGRPGSMWITYIEGTRCVTKLCPWERDSLLRQTAPLENAVMSVSVACIGADRSLVYASENINRYPYVVYNTSTIDVPQPTEFDDLMVRHVSWSAPDGEAVTGLLYVNNRLRQLHGPAPVLLVHVHGGPCVAFTDVRSNAADATRYPYRHLLAEGYAILMPLYRGTMGFGDRWAQGNIHGQGQLNNDLGDILAGVEHVLREEVEVQRQAKVSIFGGSYGGYMVIRALAVAPTIFTAGVSLYGFVHGRWMSLEGGDFTWEDEYACPHTKWPLTSQDIASDNFDLLHRITAPMLLLHGEKDDICPVSQSFVTLRVLQGNKVPTGLVVYPGEGHGFDKPANRQDRDERTLQWFKRYVPVVDPANDADTSVEA